MKRRMLLLILFLPLLTTSCIGESAEVSEAKADYIQAKTRLMVAAARIQEAEATRLELQNEHKEAIQAQQLEQERQSWKAAQARRATFENILVQTLRVLAYIVAITAMLVSLIWATSGAYEAWAKNHAELLKLATEQVQAKAQAMKEEHLAHKTKAAAFIEKRSLVQTEAYRLEQERMLLKAKASDNGRSRHPATNAAQEINDPT